MALSRTLILVSCDDIELEVDTRAAFMSQVVKNAVEVLGDPGGEAIPVMKVRGKVLHQVLEWCDHHKDVPPLPIGGGLGSVERVFHTDSWDRNFVRVAREMLLDIVLAAQFMGVEGLLQLGCKSIAMNTIETVQSNIFNTCKKQTSPASEVRLLEQAQLKNSKDWKEVERKKEAAHLQVLGLHQDVQDFVLDYILDCSALPTFFLLTRGANAVVTRPAHDIRFTQLRTVGCLWKVQHARYRSVEKLGFVNQRHCYSLYENQRSHDLKVWDLKERRVVFSKEQVVDVAVSPWGHFLTTDTAKKLQWWRVDDWQLIRTDDLPSLGRIYAHPDFLAFVPAQRIHAPHLSGVTENVGLFWFRIENLVLSRVEPPCPPKTRLLISPPKAGYIAYVTDDEIAVKTIQHDRTIVLSRLDWTKRVNFRDTSISISPDGRSIATVVGIDVLLQWTETKGAEIGISEHSEVYKVARLSALDFPTCVVHSPDSKYLAIITNIGRIMVCRSQEEAVRELLIDDGVRPNHKMQPCMASVASWSGDGEILAIGSSWGWETIGIQNMIRVAESKGIGETVSLP